ncbi:MAG: peptidase M14 [Myxococcales bacterium]|nr:peptidase M14 [Myxococcales bacterium]
MPTLASLNVGFRNSFVDYDALTRQLHGWHQAFPDLTRLRSLGRTAEGRELWLLTVGRDPDALRPAVWVDANMHATELCGTNVALGIAEDVLALHHGEDRHGLPPHVREALTEALFYVMPRISPDGAEQVIRTGRYVRSSPEDRRPQQQHPHWRSVDVNGDGRIAVMRKPDPNGELVESNLAPGMLVPRTLDHTGPFYKVFPEGLIENWDGHSVPDPFFLGDNAVDMNRNFPWSWAPEPEQMGAGDYPGSTPETRAVIEFATAHPNLYAWLNLHTFGGVVIRPLGHQPDSKMNQGDLAVYRQVEAWNTQFTTYPTVSGYHEFTYEPDKPLKGDLSDYAYHQRGCLAYVVELWDLFRRVGMDVKKPFVDHYSHWGENDFAALAAFDRDHNQGRLFQPWVPFHHPQLGDVEVGGIDIRVGISNPPFELFGELCAGQSAAFLRVAALVPRVRFAVTKTEALGGDLTRVTLRAQNIGYLATYGMPSARALPHSEALRLRTVSESVTVASAPSALLDVGHLEGWGQGLYGGWGVFLPWTRGSVSERTLTIVLQGHGEVEFVLESCRTGRATLQLTV